MLDTSKKIFPKAVAHPIFKIITQAADELRLECYVIGGYVRDFFLEKQASADIDIVAVGSGIQLAKRVSQKLPNTPQVKIYKTYGTAMIKAGEITLEFVGARKESYTSNSRNPEIETGTLQDDQERRDFTINTLAIQLNKLYLGRLLDPFRGRKDLTLGIIQTPLAPSITYADDPLRMLRAIRFASQLGFEITVASLQAIQENKDRITIISNERIVEELHKILMSPKPSIGFLLLDQVGLLPYILPEISALKGVDEIEGQQHKDNFYHSLQVVDNIATHTTNLWLRWAALLHDIGKAPTKRFDPKNGWTFHGHEFVGAKMVSRIFKRLKMPTNEKMKFVKKIVRMSSRPIIIATEVTDSAVRRLVFDAGDHIDELMTLCEADITTKNKKRLQKYLSNFRRVRAKIIEVEERDRIRNFQPPVTGQEIMEVFGIKPSREIGIIKEAIKEAILEGKIPNSHREARIFMIQKGEKIGLTTCCKSLFKKNAN